MMLTLWVVLSIFSLVSNVSMSKAFIQSVNTRSEPRKYSLLTRKLNVNIVFKGLCTSNSCKNGGTCYIKGYGKDIESYCVCPSNTEGASCEYAPSSNRNIPRDDRLASLLIIVIP